MRHYEFTGNIPKALRMELERKQQTPPKSFQPERQSLRGLRLAGHNGHRLRGTTR